MTTTSAEELREEVRKRYAESARAVSEGSAAGCGSGGCCDGETDAVNFGEALYDAEQRGKWAYFSLKRDAVEKLAVVADLKGACC